MGQTSTSQPSTAREGASSARAEHPDANWQCATVEGNDLVKHEINITPHKKELGRKKELPKSRGSGSGAAPSSARSRHQDLSSLTDSLHRGGGFTGPQSEGSFISGLSGRSSGSRASPRDRVTSGDLDSIISGEIVTDHTGGMRAREQNDWHDSEREKDMYLKRIKAQVEQLPTPSRPTPDQDSLRPLPGRAGSDAGYSDRTHDRHRGKTNRGQNQLDTQSERTNVSARSGFSLSSFKSAISGVSDRYKRRGDSEHRRSSRNREPSADRPRDGPTREPSPHGASGGSGGSSSRNSRSRREDSISYHSPREYDEYAGRHSPRREHDEYPALRDRDRDDNSSGRGSRRSRGSGRERSQSRSGSIGAEDRGPRDAVRQSRRGPGMTRGTRSDHGSDTGDMALQRYGGHDVGIASNDLEAKLKNAQRNLQEVQQELDEHRRDMEDQKTKKKREMPGGNVIQHALMQDLRDLRDYCVDIEEMKQEEESKAKEAVAKLRAEQEQRQEDIRMRQESEQMQADLQSRIDELTKEGKEYDSKLNVTSKDAEKIKKLLDMVQSERDETLALLRRAVAQKEKMKGDRLKDTQEATNKFDRLVDNQQKADNKVKELLSSVDMLLGKFSLDKEDSRSKGSARSTVTVQLELMKIRDSIRFLLKANDSAGPGLPARQTGGNVAKKRPQTGGAI